MSNLQSKLKESGQFNAIAKDCAAMLAQAGKSSSTEDIKSVVQEETFANNLAQGDDENLVGQTDDKGYSDLTKDEMSQLHDRQDKILGTGFLIGFVICKFVLHFGWIISLSLVLGLVLGNILMYYDSNR